LVRVKVCDFSHDTSAAGANIGTRHVMHVSCEYNTPVTNFFCEAGVTLQVNDIWFGILQRLKPCKLFDCPGFGLGLLFPEINIFNVHKLFSSLALHP
jgi:hypothetical protein